MTVEKGRGSCLFWGFFGFLLLCFLGAGGEKEHGKERWWSGGGWKVSWFPGSGKRGEQDQGFCRLWEQTLHSLTLLREVMSRWKVFQKLGSRHWDFLPQWLFSCPKGDIEAELTSQFYMDWNNGHLSSQFWTLSLISPTISPSFFYNRNDKKNSG